jgi:DNA-binding CsgD family transcriptional regulator
MLDFLREIAQICIHMDRTRSRAVVKELLKQAASMYGAQFTLFGMRTGRGIALPRQIVITTYPQACQDYYDSNNAHAFDPVVRKAFEVEGVFRWDGLHHGDRQLALRSEMVRNGMEFGFSCSDHGADRSIAILSFCGDRPIASGPGEWEQVAASSALLASVTNKAVTRIVESDTKDPDSTLSPTEANALQLIASGKTAKEVAAQLGVVPRTIRYYLDRAAEKLGVDSRKEAVLKAVAVGIVDIRQFPPAGFKKMGSEQD